MALFNRGQSTPLQPQMGAYPSSGFGQNTPTTQVMCPADVKQCPDGSYVGRNPAAGCAFFACPNEKPFNNIEVGRQQRTQPLVNTPTPVFNQQPQSVRQPIYRKPTTPITNETSSNNNLLNIIRGIFGG